MPTPGPKPEPIFKNTDYGKDTIVQNVGKAAEQITNTLPICDKEEVILASSTVTDAVNLYEYTVMIPTDIKGGASLDKEASNIFFKFYTNKFLATYTDSAGSQVTWALAATSPNLYRLVFSASEILTNLYDCLTICGGVIPTESTSITFNCWGNFSADSSTSRPQTVTNIAIYKRTNPTRTACDFKLLQKEAEETDFYTVSGASLLWVYAKKIL